MTLTTEDCTMERRYDIEFWPWHDSPKPDDRLWNLYDSDMDESRAKLFAAKLRQKGVPHFIYPLWRRGSGKIACWEPGMRQYALD
jgi:hypothetical protein